MKKIVLATVIVLAASTAVAMDVGLKKIIGEHGLKDPDSVMLRKVKSRNSDVGKVWCGEINAKNSYGAYVGYNHFYAIEGKDGKGSHIKIAKDNVDAAGLIDILCTGLQDH